MYSSSWSEILEKIRVGRDYQAVCPPLLPEQDRKPEYIAERALLVWSPTKDIPDAKRKYSFPHLWALTCLTDSLTHSLIRTLFPLHCF